MEVTGKLVEKLEQEAGQSKAGKPYVKQICLVETDAKFNPLVAVTAFGEDHIKQMNKLEVGMTVTILCNISSREFKGKYYHNINGYQFTNQSNNPEVNDDFITSDDDPF